MNELTEVTLNMTVSIVKKIPVVYVLVVFFIFLNFKVQNIFLEIYVEYT